MRLPRRGARPDRRSPGSRRRTAGPCRGPARAGASSSAQRVAAGDSPSSTMSICCSGTCGASDLQEGPRRLGVLDDVVGEAARDRDRVAPAARVRARPRRAGSARDRGGRASSRRREHRHAGRAQHAREPDQRQADQRGGIVALDPFEERDAERLGADAAGAVVGLARGAGRRRSRPRRGRDTCCGRRRARVWHRRSPRRAARARCERRPSGRTAPRAARLRAAWVPGLPIGRPSQSATWSEPMMSASGCSARDAACLGLGEPQRRRRRRLARRAASRRRAGATATKGRPKPLEQHPAVARRRREHEPAACAPGAGRRRVDCCFCGHF